MMLNTVVDGQIGPIVNTLQIEAIVRPAYRLKGSLIKMISGAIYPDDRDPRELGQLASTV